MEKEQKNTASIEDTPVEKSQPEGMPTPAAHEPLPAWKRFFGHLGTITHHKVLVGKLCFRAGLYRQGLAHDWSKYSPAEFWPGVRYYQGFRSPNAAQREELGYSPAWLHHKGHNKHHFEYWTDLVLSDPGNPHATASWGPVPMPVRYVVEMFCDRIAASMVYQKDKYTQASALEYYHREYSLASEMMHPETRALLEPLLETLAEQGEDAAFALARKMIAEDKAKGGRRG